MSNEIKHLITENGYADSKSPDVSKNCKCVFCNGKVLIQLKKKTYDSIVNRGNKRIQLVVPNMPNEDREFFISGICKECQDKIFM